MDHARRRFLSASAVAGGMIVVACGNDKQGQQEPKPAPGNQPEDKPQQPAKAALAYGVLLCGGNKVNPETGEKVFVFTQVNIDEVVKARGVGEGNARVITNIGFLAHGVIHNPGSPGRVVVFEKKGPGACEIDLKENKIVRRIEPAKGCEFYGHGAYSADSKILYATEYLKETYEGRMVIRDAADMKVIGEFPTHGEWPHDCTFIDDGKVVAITNGGGHIDGGAEPCVTYVEVPGGKLVEKITFDNPLLNAGHLYIGPKGDLAVVHAMREGYHGEEALGAISLRPKAGKFKTMVSPANVTAMMKGETLSVVMHHETSVVAATNPYGTNSGLVTFWDMAAQKYLSHEHLEQPRGVALTLDQKHWVITFGKERPGVILYGRETRKPLASPIAFECSSQGSHAYIHDYWA